MHLLMEQFMQKTMVTGCIITEVKRAYHDNQKRMSYGLDNIVYSRRF